MRQSVIAAVLALSASAPQAGELMRVVTEPTAGMLSPRTYYVDMSYDKDSDARLSQTISQQCHISMHTPTPNENMLSFAQSLDKEDAPPEDMELGKQFAQTVTLQCQ